MTSIYNKLCNKFFFFFLVGHICIKDKDHQMSFKRYTYEPLGLRIVCTISDDLPFYFNNVFECEYLRNGNIFLLFMLLCKCDCICETL
jgi:hypothetical protein